MREIMQNYYATVFMILFHFAFSSLPCSVHCEWKTERQSCAIKLFIEDSPYIINENMSWKIFEAAKRSDLSAAEQHVRLEWNICLTKLSCMSAVCRNSRSSRNFCNKIITNSVHVRVEKWFARRKLSSEMENLTFPSVFPALASIQSPDNNTIKNNKMCNLIWSGDCRKRRGINKARAEHKKCAVNSLLFFHQLYAP